MDIGKAFTFVFDDPRWKEKLGMGTLVTLLSFLLSPVLIGIAGFVIISGYALEVLRNVRRGDATPLPEWRDRWGEWFTDGIKVFVASLIWALPLIALYIPMIIGSALTDNPDMEAIGGFISVCFGCLVFLVGILYTLIMPAIYIRIAETGEISSALRVGEILRFTREHIGDVIIASLVYIAGSAIISLAAGILGTLLCLVGLIITLPAGQFLTMMMQAHLFGQIGRKAGNALEPVLSENYTAPAVVVNDDSVSISIDSEDNPLN